MSQTKAHNGSSRRRRTKKQPVNRLTPCPPKLKAIIDLVNSVPPAAPIPNLSETLYEKALKQPWKSLKEFAEREQQFAQLLNDERRNAFLRESRDKLRMIARRAQLSAEQLARIQTVERLQTSAAI